MSSLACLGRHHLSGLIQAAGEGPLDWSAAYRLFSCSRFNPAEPFAVARRGVLAELADDAPFVAAMDDTLVARDGRVTPGMGWRRDPLGPPFQTNFVRAQRFLQLSALLPQLHRGQDSAAGPARALPVAFAHTPTAQKPRKNASPQQLAAYPQEQRACNISRRGADELVALRAALDQDGAAARPLCALIDGRFTNSTVLKNLPPRTAVIGRIRSDAKLCFPPDPTQAASTGRRRVYGEPAPSPAQVLADDSIAVIEVEAFAAGKLHRFPVKTVAEPLWRGGSGPRRVRLIVIKPLRYRLSQTSRLLYREPAFLLVSDPDMPLEQAVQHYVWRWEIEVNFRDEKTLLGVGDAQVFNAVSVERAPQFQVAVYSLLLLAARRAFGDAASPDALPPPKWRHGRAKPRVSTQDLLQQLRQDLWGEALQPESFCHLSPQQPPRLTRQKLHPPLAAAVLYASA